MGPKKIINIKDNCQNQFWKEVCRAAIKAHNIINYNTIDKIGKALLWGNIQINNPTCHSWKKAGFTEVRDLFNVDGEVPSIEEVQLKLNKLSTEFCQHCQEFGEQLCKRTR